MSDRRKQAQPAREQWRRTTLAVAPYAVLAILVAYAVAQDRRTGGSLLIDLALCALLAGWMLWMFTLHPAWRDRTGLMALFVGGVVVILFVMVLREPWFGYFVIAAYLYAFILIPWPWRLIAVTAVATVSGTAQLGGLPPTPANAAIYAVVVAVNVLVMCGFAWISWNGMEESNQRKRALDEVSEANRRLEETLADNARLHHRLIEQARQSGILEERQRMAREIHDTLAQGLTGIITQLQAAEQAGDDTEERGRHVDAATALARESLSEARRSVLALRPEPLEAARLGDALSGVAERWSERQGVPVTVTTTGQVRPLPPEAELTLLRTAQEALANVAKHAGASRVGLTLSYLEREVALDVRDDGAGFEPARVLDQAHGGPVHDDRPSGTPDADGGFGLLAMRQRVEGLSGALQIESEPGTGTAISARIPLSTAGGRP